MPEPQPASASGPVPQPAPAKTPDLAQLQTLLTVLEEGTFESAARRLQLTPSAVSQRIRALENAIGQVLVRRGTPCTPTDAAEHLVRLARQVRLLVQETGHTTSHGIVELPVAVNADSLATWFGPVLKNAAGWPWTSLRLTVEDEGRSHDLLRRGEVLAAVTSNPQAVQGCAIEQLGHMRYRAAAAPDLIQRHRRAHGLDWAAFPLVAFNNHDRLHESTLSSRGVDRAKAVHHVPSSTDLHESVRLGLGWAMLPDQQLEPDIEDGTLAVLPGTQPVHVPLYWQRWTLDSTALDRLTDIVRQAARGGLRRAIPRLTT